MNLVWPEVEEDNEVSDVQNVHRWLNKIPLSPFQHPILDEISFLSKRGFLRLFEVLVLITSSSILQIYYVDDSSVKSHGPSWLNQTYFLQNLPL